VFRPVFDIKKPASRLSFLLVVVILTASAFFPLLGGTASASGQITNRSLTLSSGIAADTGVTYTLSFRTATTTAGIKGIKLIACTTAIGSYPGGTCTAPTGIHFDVGSFNNGATAGFTDTTNNFANDTTGANNCLSGAGNPNVLCLKRATTTGNDTNNTTNKTIQFTGITNPSTANTAFYVGIITYSTDTYTVGSIVDAGTTASTAQVLAAPR
jgi:hypothetical protein